MLMTLMIMFTINILFFFMNHPLSMGAILIMQTLTGALMTGLLIKSFWMSYILMITMLSGMLVLFIYMASLASNEKFKTNPQMIMLTIIMVFFSSMFLFMSMEMIIKNNYLSMEMSLSSDLLPFSLSKIFSSYNLYLMIMMVMYLFFTMIVSNHLVNIFEGPMRMKI